MASFNHLISLANIRVVIFRQFSRSKLNILTGETLQRKPNSTTVLTTLFSDSVEVISVFPITATSPTLPESAILFLSVEEPLLSAELAQGALRMRPSRGSLSHVTAPN